MIHTIKSKVYDKYNLHTLNGWDFYLSYGCYLIRELLDCHWLFDIIFSYQLKSYLRDNKYQVWKTSKLSNGVQISCSDKVNNVIILVNLEYDEMYLNELEIMLKDNKIACLPTEINCYGQS